MEPAEPAYWARSKIRLSPAFVILEITSKVSFLALLHSPSHLLESSNSLDTKTPSNGGEASQRRLPFIWYYAKYRVPIWRNKPHNAYPQLGKILFKVAHQMERLGFPMPQPRFHFLLALKGAGGGLSI
ncbi:hypothetical protein Tco_0534976 [Tanacetum coccineum]